MQRGHVAVVVGDVEVAVLLRGFPLGGGFFRGFAVVQGLREEVEGGLQRVAFVAADVAPDGCLRGGVVAQLFAKCCGKEVNGGVVGGRLRVRIGIEAESSEVCGEVFHAAGEHGLFQGTDVGLGCGVGGAKAGAESGKRARDMGFEDGIEFGGVVNLLFLSGSDDVGGVVPHNAPFLLPDGTEGRVVVMGDEFVLHRPVNGEDGLRVMPPVLSPKVLRGGGVVNGVAVQVAEDAVELGVLTRVVGGRHGIKIVPATGAADPVGGGGAADDVAHACLAATEMVLHEGGAEVGEAVHAQAAVVAVRAAALKAAQGLAFLLPEVAEGGIINVGDEFVAAREPGGNFGEGVMLPARGKGGIHVGKQGIIRPLGGACVIQRGDAGVSPGTGGTQRGMAGSAVGEITVCGKPGTAVVVEGGTFGVPGGVQRGVIEGADEQTDGLQPAVEAGLRVFLPVFGPVIFIIGVVICHTVAVILVGGGVLRAPVIAAVRDCDGVSEVGAAIAAMVTQVGVVHAEGIVITINVESKQTVFRQADSSGGSGGQFAKVDLCEQGQRLTVGVDRQRQVLWPVADAADARGSERQIGDGRGEAVRQEGDSTIQNLRNGSGGQAAFEQRK